MKGVFQDFSLLWGRVQSGCPQAAQELYDRYSPHIRRVVRRQLHQRMRAQFDSADFLQSVWASFFKGVPERYHFDGPDALVGFLCRVASNKVTETFRQRMQAEKYNLNRERSLEQLAEERLVHPTSRLPSPSQVASANERWERMMAGQPERHRTILEMLRQGHTHQEIADNLGLHPKVVQRFLRKLSDTGEET